LFSNILQVKSVALLAISQAIQVFFLQVCYFSIVNSDYILY